MLTVGDASLLPSLPMLIGVGLCRALSPHLPSPCRLKWPNDLIVEVGGERKKIGGVLIEASVRPGEETLAILGFGVNYLHGASDLPETATSLVLLGGGVVSLVDLTWDLVEGIEAELTHFGDTAYAVESYRALSIHDPGERIACRVGERLVEGTFQGFDETGLLLLESGGQRIAVAAGEVMEP